MAFPEFRFPATLPSFVGHEAVLRYLNDYAKHFHIADSIKVRRVLPYVLEFQI